MINAVASLGEAEVRSIVEEQGKIEVTCDFCAQTYILEEKEVLDTIHAAVRQ
jgi:molecular chaperone Hsp33